MSWSSNLYTLVQGKEKVTIKTIKRGVVIVDSSGHRVTKSHFPSKEEAQLFCKKMGLTVG